MCGQTYVPMSIHMEAKRGYLVSSVTTCLISLLGISHYLKLTVFHQGQQTQAPEALLSLPPTSASTEVICKHSYTHFLMWVLGT